MLGCFDGAKSHHATHKYYKCQQQYQDDDYNLSGLLSWEAEIINQYFPLNSKIVVAGSGGGREALALKKKGFDVTAFDCNKDLVRSSTLLARKEELELSLMDALPDRVPNLVGLWDGALIGWGAYMHISGTDTRIRFLKQIRSRLSLGSPILLSFFTRRPSSKTFRIIYSLATPIRLIRMSKHKLELGDTINGSFDHHFTEDEIFEELRKADFEPVFYAEQPYGHAVAIAS